MKKTTFLMTALIMLFISAPQAKATPMYYTFEGTVDSSLDGAGAIAAQLPSALTVGSPVTYTIILDFAADGTQTYIDGTTDTFPTSSGYFYTDAYSGDYLLEVGGGTFNAGTDIAAYNYGYDYPTYGSLSVNSDDEYMSISSSSSLFFGMLPGYSGLTGEDYAYNNNNFSYIKSSLTLMSISASPPVSVPEPSTLLLLGSGLLGLGMFRRVRGEG